MIDSYKITQFLTNKELFEYLRIATDVGNLEFILKYKQKLGELAGFVADQNHLRTKAKSKLPRFFKAGCFYTLRSLEQCTDEAVAQFKASQIKGKKLLTLASGLGVDDFAFSASFHSVVSVDNDEILNTLVAHNFGLLGLSNIRRLTMTAEDFILENKEHFSAIYIDPDRRDEKGRQILLSQHRPDVIALLPELLKISDEIWIKCSPIYDIAMALQEVAHISEIHCIALKGEMKEMLLKADNKLVPELKIICTDIQTSSIKSETFSNEDELPAQATDITGYFFEAGAALVKARKHRTSAARRGLCMIDRSVPFYTGETADPAFMGKCMQILNTLPYNVKGIKTYLRSNGISSINIKSRGTKAETAGLFKQLGTKEGGEDFLFICPFMGKTVVVHCAVTGNQ